MSRRRTTDVRTVLRVMFLTIFFPAGLVVLWSRRCHWPRFLKMALSLVVVAGILFIVLPQTAPPDAPKSGVVLVGTTPNVEVFGPEAPAERLEIDVYTPHQTVVVIEASPTPKPVMVYCNAGGKYYHSKDCRFIKETTGYVTISQALDAGYSKCPDCNAPDQYGH